MATNLEKRVLTIDFSPKEKKLRRKNASDKKSIDSRKQRLSLSAEEKPFHSRKSEKVFFSMLFFPFPEQLKAYLGYNIDISSLIKIIELTMEMICHCDVTTCNICPGSVRVFSRKVEKLKSF